MKRIITIISAMLITAGIWAQSPEKMSYQAVIRDANDQLVTNQDIGMQISILQGSVGGTAVYVETHSPTSNANGLVTIEIGSGITSDDFSAIDWANDIYFLKTETDPTTTGGTNYTITGTSQLLSVPYAMHSKTVESVDYSQITSTPFIPSDISDLTDNSSLLFDGEWSSLLNTPTTISGYGITDAFDGNYNSLTNLPTLFDGEWSSLTNTPTTIAGYGITDAFSGNYNDLTNKPLNATTTTDGFMSAADKTKLDGIIMHYIGESYGGGIIFWLDASGQHGLIAATTDQSTGIQWYNGTNRYTGTIGDGLYTGEMNAVMIVATQIADNQTGNFAAKVCTDYSVTVGGVTYGDWYLPSKYELNLLYDQKDIVGGFGGNAYWSSTEFDNGNAWYRFFGVDIQGIGAKFNTYYVRAVRAF